MKINYLNAFEKGCYIKNGLILTIQLLLALIIKKNCTFAKKFYLE